MADHLADHRLELIMSVLKARGECRTTQLAQQFDLSEMTLRRDLHTLEKRGLLKRVHGGAVLLNSDVNYSLRLQQDQIKKQAIGLAATRFLKSGQTIYIDAGTTTLELARAIRQGLPQVTDLQIITHGITIATELAGQTPYHLQLIGGDVYQNALSTVGPLALAQIADLNIDHFFMAAVGVDQAMGWSNSNHVEAVIKRAVIERSKSSCALADSSKWNQPSYAPIVPFDAMSTWVVNPGLPDDALAAARAAQIELVIA
ncbi:DeoR/GlpR family DNA-binding transcription regulator [Methylobacillus flagellatus]|uniref:DeoR/GlpR family DNA-binding transcription regulator n=1 Tax=Methylobacillus flagellatus TaxID=405 RepID=UPI0010F71FE4|nr:DeoR/GlpR family DNA-binding transcription regulator [Methylobacillus flagellatus]